MNHGSSGFFWAVLILIGVISFAAVSIDRAPLSRVTIVGDLSEMQLSAIKQQVQDAEFSDTDHVQGMVETMDWVAEANIRKRWPAGIEIEVVPEVVIAYWNDDAYINKTGDVLVTDLLEAGDLPHLYGPVGREFEVMTRYQQLQPVLGTYGHDVRVLTLSARGAWSLETSSDIEVMLGKEDLKARIQRFLAVSHRLTELGDSRRVNRMDARYANGVAVHYEDELKIADINKRAGEQSL